MPCTAAETNAVFENRMNGGALTEKELGMYKGFLLTNLGRLYHKHNIAMQLHIKALRNNSKRMFRALGADTGFDSMNDFAFAPMLGAFLNDMDEDDALPKTVLYSLNPGDNPMLASMAGNFTAPGIRSKCSSVPHGGSTITNTAWNPSLRRFPASACSPPSLAC